MVYKPANGLGCPEGTAVAKPRRPAAAPVETAATSATSPSITSPAPKSGLSTKQKVIIGVAIGAAITGAIIACVKSDGCGGGGGGGAPTSFGPAGGLSASGIFPAGPELLLFGGQGHKTFLGCLNCSEYDPGSIFNKYGEHGSPYSAESIFNNYSEFGSRYSSYSACNTYATDPPIIVDRGGNAYGRLTLNRYAYQVNNASIVAWLSGVCQR